MKPTSLQKSHGVYYTSQSVVQYIVERTMGPLCERGETVGGQPLRVLDPSCGDGAFLEGALTFLASRTPTEKHEASAAHRCRLIDQLFGIDIDREVLRAAGDRLVRAALQGEGSPECDESHGAKARDLTLRNLRWGDFLLDRDAIRADFTAKLLSRDWKSEFPEVFSGRNPGFDVLVGNPPYVNARVLSQTRSPSLRAHLRRRYRCATKAYDLYVLFVERAWEWLREGGRCGMIVPNKIAGLDYARQCRELLLERTSLVEIVDLAGLKLFPGASVYPYIVIFEKKSPPPGHRVSLVHARCESERLVVTGRTTVAQASLSASDGWSLQQSLDVESRVPTLRLIECGEVHSGTTGFMAHALAQSLSEHDAAGREQRLEFIVSGNIGRYRIEYGGVRYMSRRWQRPVLSPKCPILSDRKRALFREGKIVVAGMSRRLEAAWDEGGTALGVQVFAVARLEDPWYVLGLLNSKLFSYLFRTRFEAKRLGGGYLSVNKGQLAELPVRQIDRKSKDELLSRTRISRLARRLTGMAGSASLESLQRLDAELDQEVYRLYRLNSREVRCIESVINGIDGKKLPSAT
jgi:hypothetical protein